MADPTGLYLQWQDYSPGDANRILSSMFSTLSRRWYPVNIIGSTVYDVLGMYADQLSSESVELSQTFADLYIETARTTAIGSQVTAKMYDNFGVLLEANKLAGQAYLGYSTVNELQDYRQRLRLLGEGFLAGSSVEGLQRIGQAFSGVAPLVGQPTKEYPGWVLTTITGSVKAIGSNFIVSTLPVPRFGSIFATDDPGDFTVGGLYVISWSKLETNTKIRDSKYLYSTIDVWFYVSGSAVDGFQVLPPQDVSSSVVNAVKKVIRADLDPRIRFTDKFVYWRPVTVYPASASLVSSTLAYSPYGYLYNYLPTFKPSGSSWISTVLTLPADYQSYDWYYDWTVLTRNDAYYKMFVRSYPAVSIPDSVPYRQYNREPVPLMSLPGTGSFYGAHYVVDSTAFLTDISGNGNNLTASIVGVAPSFTRGRNESRIGFQVGSASFEFSGSTSTSMEFTKSFFVEMWVRGLDFSAVVGNVKYMLLKRVASPVSATPSMTAGWQFEINVPNQKFYLKTRDSGGKETGGTGSITNLLAEVGQRYHCLAASYVSGSIYMYADGALLSTTGGIVQQGAGSPNLMLLNVIKTAGTSYTGFDEIVVGRGFLTPQLAQDRFEQYNSRIVTLGLPSASVDRYHQAKIQMYASGSSELEWHQFAIRGLADQGYFVVDNRGSDILRLPLFPTGSF